LKKNIETVLSLIQLAVVYERSIVEKEYRNGIIQWRWVPQEPTGVEKDIYNRRIDNQILYLETLLINESERAYNTDEIEIKNNLIDFRRFQKILLRC